MKSSDANAPEGLSNISLRVFRKLVRTSTQIGLSLFYVVCAPVQAGTHTISTNQWIGTEDSNWFNPLNWYYGDIFDTPLTFLNTYITPIMDISPGVPPNTFAAVPLREAVLGAYFPANDFHLLGWDGLSQVRLTQGGLLDTSPNALGYVGNDNPVSVYGGRQQSASLIFDGGHIAGNWIFAANSRVEIRGQYNQKEGVWSGTLGELVITKGSSASSKSLEAVSVKRLNNDGVFNLVSSNNRVGSISNSGEVSISAGAQFWISGAIANNGDIRVIGSDLNAPTWLNLDSDVDLSGTGTVVLSSLASGSSLNGHAVIYGYNRKLSVGSMQTIRGAGNFIGSLNVLNQGLVMAEGGRLSLQLDNDRAFDNSKGRIEIAPGSTLDLVAGTVRGGYIYSSETNGVLTGGSGSAAIYKDVTLEGKVTLASNYPFSRYSARLSGNTTIGSDAVATISNGNSFDVEGRITNNGRFAIGIGEGNASTLFLRGDTTLAGVGKTVLSASEVYTRAVTGNNVTLTIAPGHTFTGLGQIYGQGLKVLNQGRLAVDGSEQTTAYDTLSFDLGGGSFINEGRIDVAAHYAMTFSGQILHQTASGAVLHVDGLVLGDTIDLAAGTLKGTGTIIGNVIVGSGTVAPGNSPGKLSIDGNLTMGASSTLELQVMGNSPGVSYDWLDVNGNLTLDGKLVLDFSTYKPKVGDTFEFLTVRGGNLSGAFDSVAALGYTLTTTADGNAFAVTVAGINPVPEPPGYLLLLVGLGTLEWARKRVHANRGLNRLQ